MVSGDSLAAAWGIERQALGAAAARGEVFAIVIKRVQHFPSEFLEFRRDDVAAVCEALGQLSAAEKLVFWKRRHGVLGGKTVLQTLLDTNDAESLNRVTQLAQNWALEAGAQTNGADGG